MRSRRHGYKEVWLIFLSLLLQQCWWPVLSFVRPPRPLAGPAGKKNTLVSQQGSFNAALDPHRHLRDAGKLGGAFTTTTTTTTTYTTTYTTTMISAAFVDKTDTARPRYYASVLAEEVALDREQRNTTRIDSALESLVALTQAANNDNNNEGQGTSTTTRTPANLRFVRGLYEVAHVKTVRAGENPVGGQWTRKGGLAAQVFRSRRSFQHILGIDETGRGRRTVWLENDDKKNADDGGSNGRKKKKKGVVPKVQVNVLGEAVNVISLSAFWGIMRATVILRGDVVGLDAAERTRLSDRPLTSNAVRALFDPPRIALGQYGRIVNVSLGPRTTVVLDAPYVDNRIRLGLGARSGTRFVFRRCSPADVEANEFRELLYRQPMGRIPLVAVFGGLAGVVAWHSRTPVGISIALLSLLMATLFGTTGGGIERNDRSVGDSKKVYGQ